MVLMGVTGGVQIVDEIQKLQKTELAKAVIFDAVASETVDACFDWIQEYFRQQLIRENKQLTQRRISCGYGDFALDNQKKFFDLLQLKRFSVTINESSILIPEKTATAVAGVIQI